jgi:hypothetical protein
MTFEPPPPPPPPGGPTPPPPAGGQPQYGPPAGGAPYGAPAGSPYGTPTSGFDPKSVDTLDWGILGAGLLAFIFSFMSFYSYSDKHCSSDCLTIHNSAWHGFFGWFAVLLAVIGAAAVALSIFASQVKMPVPPRLLGLGCFAVATLCMILALFVYPGSASYHGLTGSTSGADKSHGFAYWIVFILIIVGLVLSLMRFQQSGGQLPGGLNRMPNIGGRAPGSPPPPPPPQGGPGYGPPAGGSGYGPPAP